MSKSRVQLWGKPNGYVLVDRDATDGAVVGANLRWPDGRLVQEAELRALPAAGDGIGVGYWSMLTDVPVNVQAVGALTGDGFVRKAGEAWSAAPIVNADLSGATTDGLAEGATRLYHTTQRAADAAPIQALVAGENIAIDTTDPRRPVVSTSVQDGRDGQVRYTGTGPPPAVIVGSRPGDTYMDLASGDVYKLT